MANHFTKIIQMNHQQIQSEELILDEITDNNHSLILYNDDITPFDFVMESLIEVCNHNPVQAEQCTLIAHMKGRAIVKKGTYKVLAMMQDALSIRGLQCEVD